MILTGAIQDFDFPSISNYSYVRYNKDYISTVLSLIYKMLGNLTHISIFIPNDKFLSINIF